MRIGSLTIQRPVLLAPMAAVTDLPFRTLCEELGVGLTITEFLSAHALVQGAEKTVGKLTASLAGRPFGVQIFGREPEVMAAAAGRALAIGAALVDINMGCPAKRVVAGACGSALMKEPQLAQTLVRAVRAALPATMPVTVKHRAGWDERHLNAPEFACAMVEAGAAMITVHGRTRTQAFSGRADRQIIRRVREAVPGAIPVVGNGDVVSVEDDRRMRDETGCDAVMIGRGAMGNPWLFAAIAARLGGDPTAASTCPTPFERARVFDRHVTLIEAHAPLRRRLAEVRKAVAWYSRGLRDAARLRERAFAIDEPAALVQLAQSFFARGGDGGDSSPVDKHHLAVT